jgi:3-carboxy-cis,cis-muconate cycloisomerase
MTEPLLSSSLFAPMFSSAAMRAAVNDHARLQRMLDVEAALARAEADVGVIPGNAVAPIAAACRAEIFDIAAIAAAGPAAGNVLIPLVKALTAAVAKDDADAARYAHWGATSQDIIDTALVLELRVGIDVLVSDLDRAIAAFATLADRHRHTPTVARTWLQHALPMPFGLKLAGYASALVRARERLLRLRTDALVLQFGGAAGTLAALGERGLEVSERLAAHLDLPLPEAPWHSHRDRLAEVAAALAILSGSCGKIARDVTLLMQTDVAEVFEPAAPGRGGSSTMPQKRNPTAAAALLAAAAIAPQRFSAAKFRSTSARPDPGSRSGRPFQHCCSSSPVRSPESSTLPKASRSTARACAPISIQRTGWSWPKPCRSLWRPRSASTTRISL